MGSVCRLGDAVDQRFEAGLRGRGPRADMHGPGGAPRLEVGPWVRLPPAHGI